MKYKIHIYPSFSNLKSYQLHLLVFFILFITIFIANYNSIFDIYFLAKDDVVLYRRFLRGDIFTDYLNVGFGAFRSFYHLQFSTWLTTYNIYIARIFIVLTMSLSAFLFYRLLITYFSLPKSVALMASLLPNILPNIISIPVSVNASYPAKYLFIYLASLLFALKYVDSDEGKKRYLLLAVIFYFLFHSTSISIFTIPFTIALLFLFRKNNKNYFYVITIFLAISMWKFITMVARGNKQPADISFDTVIKRINEYFEWVSPFINIDGTYILLGSIATITTAMYLSFKRPELLISDPNNNNRRLTPQNAVLYIYGLFFIWAITNIIVFILKSDAYQPRYAYMSAYGFSIILISSIYILSNILIKSKKINLMLLACFLGYYIINTHLLFQQDYAHVNKYFLQLKKEFKNKKIPPDSQIVVAKWPKTNRYFSRGWRYSSGTIMFALNRQDVGGLLIRDDPSYHFSSHVNNKRRGGKKHFATGISAEEPIYLYQFQNGHLKPASYLLEYKDDTSWIIYKVDKTANRLRIFDTGIGKKDYFDTIEFLKKEGISRDDILWG